MSIYSSETLKKKCPAINRRQRRNKQNSRRNIGHSKKRPSIYKN